MANAMNILKDNLLIDLVCYRGTLLKIYPEDCFEARQIKTLINNSGYLAFQAYNSELEQNQRNICEVSNKRLHSSDKLQFKVNHYRQKLWYWKPIKK